MKAAPAAELLQLAYSRWGGRKMHIVPLWPDVRGQRAASLGVDTRPALPGIVPGFRMPGLGEPPAA